MPEMRGVNSKDDLGDEPLLLKLVMQFDHRLNGVIKEEDAAHKLQQITRRHFLFDADHQRALASTCLAVPEKCGAASGGGVRSSAFTRCGPPEGGTPSAVRWRG